MDPKISEARIEWQDSGPCEAIVVRSVQGESLVYILVYIEDKHPRRSCACDDADFAQG
jgi:hypothetical protein